MHLGDKMSKVVMVVLLFLAGLALLVSGVLPQMDTYCDMIAGILIIILSIVIFMKKSAPAK